MKIRQNVVQQVPKYTSNPWGRVGWGGGGNGKATMVLLLGLKFVWHSCIVTHSTREIDVTGAEMELTLLC